MATESTYSEPPKDGTTSKDQPSSPASTSSNQDTRETREQLQNTTIDSTQQNGSLLSSTDAGTVDLDAENLQGARGRPSKKRSYEDLAKDNAESDPTNSDLPEPKRSDHKRVRSVDQKTQEAPSQEETDMDAQSAPGGPGILIEAPSKEEMATTEQKQETTTIPKTSGFANASSTSPFGGKTPTQEEPQTTSSDAFSQSGLSAFAASSKSPFGAGSGSKSPFGGGAGFGGSSAGGFGSAKSGFGSTSGFGAASQSSSFGTPKPFGASTTFGAPKPFGSNAGFGSGKSAFGARTQIGAAKAEKADEEGDEETQDDDETSSKANMDAPPDPRFHEQHGKLAVDTGEEAEETQFQARARLYFFDGAWKDRGVGVFKINSRVIESATDDPESQSSGRQKARLLMRADATHRVLLNSPVFSGMQFGAPDGSKPTGKIMHLQSLEDGKPVALQIKIGKEEVLSQLYTQLQELVKNV